MQPYSASSPVVQAVTTMSVIPNVKLPWHRHDSGNSLSSNNSNNNSIPSSPAVEQVPPPLTSAAPNVVPFVPPQYQPIEPPPLAPVSNPSPVVSQPMSAPPPFMPAVAPAAPVRLAPFAPGAARFYSSPDLVHNHHTVQRSAFVPQPFVPVAYHGPETPASPPDNPQAPPQMVPGPPLPPSGPPVYNSSDHIPPAPIIHHTASLATMTPPEGESPNLDGSRRSFMDIRARTGWNDPSVEVLTKVVVPKGTPRVATPPVGAVSPSVAASSLETLAKLSSKCSEMAVYATKKKLEDVDKKLTILTEKLQQNNLSPSFLNCLGQVSEAIDRQDLDGALLAYNAMAKSCAFGEVGQFMLPLKLLLLTAQQVQVFNGNTNSNPSIDNGNGNEIINNNNTLETVTGASK